MKNYKKGILSLFMLITCMSCMDVIDVGLPEGTSVPVIDAWINNLEEPQIIRLRRTAPFFSNAALPAINGAFVQVTDSDGKEFLFVEDGNTGNYVWTPPADSAFGEVGKDYLLTIINGTDTFTATSSMKRTVASIDSFIYEFREETIFEDEGIYAEFFARDLEGVGDAYWIKTYRNGNFLNKPDELNFAYDAGFDPGSPIDGVIFIQPFREAINGDFDDNSPWEIEDTILVEIHSLTEEAFYFLDEAQTQMTLGDNTIFAPPASNIPTNINSDAASEEAVGLFSVSSVIFLSDIILEENIREED